MRDSECLSIHWQHQQHQWHQHPQRTQTQHQLSILLSVLTLKGKWVWMSVAPSGNITRTEALAMSTYPSNTCNVLTERYRFDRREKRGVILIPTERHIGSGIVSNALLRSTIFTYHIPLRIRARRWYWEHTEMNHRLQSPNSSRREGCIRQENQSIFVVRNERG